MNQEQINFLIATRHFSRYVVDGDEILIQQFGVQLDEEPQHTWRAFLTRTSDFCDSARWRAYEDARVASGRITAPRSRSDADGEMRRCLVESWNGTSVPDDIDQLFGGLTLDYLVGPRTLSETLAESEGSTASQ